MHPFIQSSCFSLIKNKSIFLPLISSLNLTLSSSYKLLGSPKTLDILVIYELNTFGETGTYTSILSWPEIPRLVAPLCSTLVSFPRLSWILSLIFKNISFTLGSKGRIVIFLSEDK